MDPLSSNNDVLVSDSLGSNNEENIVLDPTTINQIMHDYKLLLTSDTSKEEVMLQSFRYVVKTVPGQLWKHTVEESEADQKDTYCCFWTFITTEKTYFS